MSEKNNISAETNELLLANLLQSCTKDRIKSIAKQYNIKLSEKNTKQQMIDAVIPEIEVSIGIKIKHYSREELKICMDCFTDDEISEQLAENIINSQPFVDGTIYIINRKSKLFAAVPHEFAGTLMMNCVRHCFNDSADDVERCALALAAIYGSFTPEMLSNVANSAFSMNLTARQAEEYLSNAASDAFTYADGQAVSTSLNSTKIKPEAAGMDYYIPTRSEIDSYATYGADSNDYYYRQTVNFIYNNPDIPYNSAEALVRGIADWCRSDEDFSAIIAVIKNISQHQIKLSADRYSYLLGMIGELYNRTRKPCLKGHKPDEVDGIKPIVAPSIQINPKKPEPVKTERKPGRNDPCPCGSGKKYKKCCGKNK